MGGRSVGDDEEFPGNILEEYESEGFESIATDGGREKEDMSGIMWGKMKSSHQLGKELNVIRVVGREEEGLSKRVKGGMGEDQRVVEVRKGREGDAVTKKKTALMANDGKFVVAGMLCGAMEIGVDAKGAGEGGSSDSVIIEVNIKAKRI